MTIYKPIRPLAEQAAEVAIKLARKEKITSAEKFKNDDIQVDAIQLEPKIVEISNYEQTVIKDGHITLNEDPKTLKSKK